LDVAEQTIADQVGAGDLNANPTPTTGSTITVPDPRAGHCTAIDGLETVTHELIHYNNPAPAEDPNNILDVENHLLRAVAHRAQMASFYDGLLQRWGHCMQDCCEPDGEGGYRPKSAALPRSRDLAQAEAPRDGGAAAPTFTSVPCCGGQLQPDHGAAVPGS